MIPLYLWFYFCILWFDIYDSFVFMIWKLNWPISCKKLHRNQPWFTIFSIMFYNCQCLHCQEKGYLVYRTVTDKVKLHCVGIMMQEPLYIQQTQDPISPLHSALAECLNAKEFHHSTYMYVLYTASKSRSLHSEISSLKNSTLEKTSVFCLKNKIDHTLK